MDTTPVALKPQPRVWHYEPEPVQGMPPGFHKVPAELVCLNPETGRLVVFGTPHQEAPDNTGHSCDEMGCGWHHALLTADVVQPERLLELPEIEGRLLVEENGDG